MSQISKRYGPSGKNPKVQPFKNIMVFASLGINEEKSIINAHREHLMRLEHIDELNGRHITTPSCFLHRSRPLFNLNVKRQNKKLSVCKRLHVIQLTPYISKNAVQIEIEFYLPIIDYLFQHLLGDTPFLKFKLCNSVNLFYF